MGALARGATFTRCNAVTPLSHAARDDTSHFWVCPRRTGGNAELRKGEEKRGRRAPCCTWPLTEGEGRRSREGQPWLMWRQHGPKNISSLPSILANVTCHVGHPLLHVRVCAWDIFFLSDFIMSAINSLNNVALLLIVGNWFPVYPSRF